MDPTNLSTARRLSGGMRTIVRGVAPANRRGAHHRGSPAPEPNRRGNKSLQLTRLVPSSTTSVGYSRVPLRARERNDSPGSQLSSHPLSRFVSSTWTRVESDRAARGSEGPSSRLPPAQRTYGARRGFAMDRWRGPGKP